MTLRGREGNRGKSRPVRERTPSVPGLSRLVVVILLTTFAGCDPVPDYLKEDLKERRLAETGLENPDPSGTSTSAGLSVLRSIHVEEIDAGEIGADTLSPGFARLVHRCGTCHATPSPRIRSATEWKYVFSRMDKHMKEAGLIPLSHEDHELILAFLQKHARSR